MPWVSSGRREAKTLSRSFCLLSGLQPTLLKTASQEQGNSSLGGIQPEPPSCKHFASGP